MLKSQLPPKKSSKISKLLKSKNSSLFHRLGGAIKRGCVEIFSFIFPPCYMASKNINIFTGYVVSRKNIDIFTGVANTP